MIRAVPNSEEDRVQEVHASRHTGLGCGCSGLFFNILPCALNICLSPFQFLCSIVSNLWVNRCKGKQLMASYLLSVPKMLIQAGDHCCQYHPWGTPTMLMCFSAARHPQEPRPSSAAGIPCVHHKGRQMGPVVSKWCGKQWCFPKEEHHSRRWGSRCGGPGWGWRSWMGCPGQGEPVVPAELGVHSDPALPVAIQ